MPDRRPAATAQQQIAWPDPDRRHRLRRLWVAGFVLPLAAFVLLAVTIGSPPLAALDHSGLQWVHGASGPGADRAFTWISHLGFHLGVLPFDIAFVLALAARRRWREGAFALLALGGSMAFNSLLKDAFARPRPGLWEHLIHYPGYSFPSGHAMATMTLSWVLVLLAWRTRWRRPVLGFMAGFTLLVGISRPYAGVHYPSDVLAGWAFGTAWAVASYLLVFRQRHPWQGRQLSGADESARSETCGEKA